MAIVGGSDRTPGQKLLFALLVGALLAIPVGTVKTRVRTGIAALRGHLGSEVA